MDIITNTIVAVVVVIIDYILSIILKCVSICFITITYCVILNIIKLPL